MKKYFLMMLIAIGSLPGYCQVLDSAGLLKIRLQDSSVVLAAPGFDPDGSRTYYYLPSGLRLSALPDSTPQFSFLTYSETDGGEISGAILHFLLEWGLTPGQEAEADAWLKAHADSTAVLAGAASLELPESAPGFRIRGKGKLGDLLRDKLTLQPVAPVIPGTKMAFSYRLTGPEAVMFREALDDRGRLAAVSIELAFTFRGGNAAYWHNLIKGGTYYLEMPLDRLLAPVINPEKPKK